MSYTVTISGHHPVNAAKAEKDLHHKLAKVVREHQEEHGGDAVSHAHFSGVHVQHTLVGEHAMDIHKPAAHEEHHAHTEHGEHRDPETGRFESGPEE